MSFNDKSIFKSVPSIIKFLIKPGETSAKDFLKNHKDIKSDDYKLLSEFGNYTIEALLVHVLAQLASAYDGYKFYLPAFLDFHGQIYRSGVLHFHECDLARSLVLIRDSPDTGSLSRDELTTNIAIATAFHYKSFHSYSDAISWVLDNLDDIGNQPYKYALQAKQPFQFLANIRALVKKDYNVLARTPITQDA
ncbi:hypothetical protein ACH5RR_023196 [Cinchona calisaya]|uniref:Uncharacterized protein n=1 Tax=Cinchona calisaya TaxID=153742 RepID=A0ABD2ZBH4_9GENT